MSEIGDTFDASREVSREKRASNRQFGAAALRLAGIEYTSNNGGVHLIVTNSKGAVDYWPGTGLWMPRNSNIKRRGVKALIQFMKDRDDHKPS